MQYLVVVNTDTIEGGSLEEAEQHGLDEQFIKSYLERIVPAGSPLTIHKVIRINPGP